MAATVYGVYETYDSGTDFAVTELMEDHIFSTRKAANAEKKRLTTEYREKRLARFDSDKENRELRKLQYETLVAAGVDPGHRYNIIPLMDDRNEFLAEIKKDVPYTVKPIKVRG